MNATPHLAALTDARANDGQFEIENLRVTLSKKREEPVDLVRGVSLTVPRGRIVGLIGESGSGKTLTCRAAVGALPHGVAISGGRIKILGKAVRGFRVQPMKTDRLEIAIVFADPHASLDPLQRIGHQIAEMASVHQGLRRAAARAEALDLLERVRITDPERVFRLFPFELSGGMAQRAMIASALAAKPAFLLADEPTSALDATVQLEILDVLKGLAKTDHIGILITTHDMAVVARSCDSIGVMYAGKLMEYGETVAVLDAPQHPYTQLLLRARPRGVSGERLVAIPGGPPAPGEGRGACPFAPRCPLAAEICLQEEPPLAASGASLAACHFAGSMAVRDT